MLRITALLLLIATSSFVSCDDEVNVDFAFYCPTNCWFTVQLWEWDSLSASDTLSEKIKYRSEVSKQYVQYVSFNPILDGDEFGSRWYQFYITVEHNCGIEENKVLNTKIYLSPPCLIGKSCSRNFYVNLNHLQGESTIHDVMMQIQQ